MIKGGSFIPPTIARLGQKFQYLKYNCNNVAIYWGNILFQFHRDWDKIRENILFQFHRDWDKIRENILFQFHRDWEKTKRRFFPNL
jgi:hypothetical protein